VAAEYEVNIKINSQEIERELGKIDRTVAKIGKPKGGGSRRKPGIAGLLPSSEELRAAEKGLVQLTAKTKNIQSIQDKFSERRTRALTRSISLNEKELRVNKRITAEARARLRLLSQSGAKGFDATRPKGRQLADDINARAKAQDKRAKLVNKINEMEAKGLNVAKLRKQLGKATTEQARGRFAGAQKEFRLLQKTIELEQSKLRILKEQRKGFASSPIQGTATMAGSPKQIAEFNKQAARNQRRAERDDRRAEADRRRDARIRRQEQRAFQGRLRAGVGPESVFGPLRQLGRASMIAGADEAKLLAGRFRAPSSPLSARPVTRASADQAAKQLEQQVRARAASEKRAADAAAAYKMQQDKQVFRAQLDLDRMEYKQKIDDIVRYTNREIQEGNRAGRAFDKELNRRTKQREISLKRGSKRLGDVALGAGFPLLFGGGAGSVIGGGLGGLTGSFGAQIGLSAAGQQIDQLIGRTITSAESLTSVGKALDFLRDRSLFSSKESEQLARKLENQGDLAGIAALVTEELNEALGPDGIQKMQDLAEETRLAKEQWGQLTTNLELLIAGPLAKFLEIVNATLGIKVAQSNFARSFELLKERDPERLKGLIPSFEGAKDPAAAIASNLTYGPNMAGGVFNMQGLSEGALISFTEQLNSILAEETGLQAGALPITEEDRKRFKLKGKTRKDKLPGLRAEREKLERLLDLEEKRFEFELKGDRAAIARMEAREKVAKIAEEIKKINASDLTTEEKKEALAVQGLENARVNLELGFQLAQIDKDRLAQIEELRIKTEEINPVYQQQLALAEGIADTFGTTMVQAFDAMVAGTERFDVAIRRLVAGALSDMAKQLFRIFVIEQAIRSIGAAFAPLPVFGSGGGVDQFGRGTLGPNYGIRQFANGGRPPVGRPSLVGERGPELFVPDRSGTIIPNHAMSSTSVVVNVDASGTEVQGNQGGAEQLGRLIGAAVQAELIKQKRPGGLLTR
jgi:hypothetical protein